MENHKPINEDILIRHFERLETKWAELNVDIDHFIGTSDQTSISYEDFNKFLDSTSEENNVVKNCLSLARFLTDNNNTDHGGCEKSSETGNNANDRVECDELSVENTEGSETLMVMPVKESEEPSSSMIDSFSTSNPNVKDGENTENDHLNLHDNTAPPEQFDTNFDCSTLSNDINDISVNLSSEHKTIQEQNLNVITDSNCSIIENVTKTNVVVLERDLVDNKLTHPVEAVSKSTDMFTIDQNQMPNLFSNKEEGDNSPQKSTSVEEEEEDNDDCISLCLENEENYFSDMFSKGEEKNNSHENCTYVDKDSNEDCLPNSNKKQQSIFIDSNLNKYSNDKQITGLHCNGSEFMSNEYDKNVSYDEVKSVNTSHKRHITIDFESDAYQETSVEQNVPDDDGSDFYKDIYTWGDEHKFFIEVNSSNDPAEFNLLSDNFYQHNSYQKPSRTDNLTDGRKRKNMILFRNVCYFYVINKCNRSCCAFPHIIPDVAKVKLELKKINNHLLIEEYDLIKDNKIKVDYGLCFLEECSERNLSREVVRMAIDFMKIPNNNEEKHTDFHSIIVKTTLHHLNKANNLDECRDLLITADNFSGSRCFGDILLETISTTEHFSSYKVAFVKLIDLIIPKAFSNKITKDILKQICGIANEAPLSRALLNMIRYTHPKILQDPMIGQFENIIKHDNELISEFLKLKTDMLQNLKTTSGDNTNSATNTFHNNTQGSTNNVSSPNICERLGNNTNTLISKAALPINLLPATRQGPSNDKYGSSSDMHRRLSSDTRTTSVPNETLPSNPLPVSEQGSSNCEDVSSSNIYGRLSVKNRIIYMPKEALPSNPLPVTEQDSSNSKYIPSSNVHRRVSSDTRTSSLLKEALPSIPLPVAKQDSSNSEYIPSSNIHCRVSSDTRTSSVPKEALPSNPLPVTEQGSSNSEYIPSSKIHRRVSSDTRTSSVPKEALPSNQLPVTEQDSSNSKYSIPSSNIHRRVSSDTRTSSVPKEVLPSNPLPVREQNSSSSKYIPSSNIYRRVSSDTGTSSVPKKALPKKPLSVTRQGPRNNDHVLSSNVTRRYSSDTKNIFEPKETLSHRKPLPHTQDPNYVNKDAIKRRKSVTKIHPWGSKDKLLDGTKENHTK